MPVDAQSARFDDRLHPAGRLLDAAEIDAIVAGAPAELLEFQRVAAAIPLDERPTMGSWLERFHAGFDRLAA